MMRRLFAGMILVCVLVGGTARGDAQNTASGMLPPPRLSLVDGSVSFGRPGAQSWVAAHVNTPLASGDELYTGQPANCEVQVGALAFVRAGDATVLGLSAVEPDFLQLKVTAGEISFDARELSAGHTVEIDTPQAAFTIERSGYYRVHVEDSSTSFITRRGGSATAISDKKQPVRVSPSEELVISGTHTPRLQTYVAPDLDEWDRWNYNRTDQLLDSMSARYVPPGVYGARDLDHYGNWRSVENYGPVWVPHGVASGWAPYTTGDWIRDPFYGWTWVDEAPWGWAPFHYGRWVFFDGVWSWAPGPLVRTPVYAPALVGFLDIGGRSGWVALGWGEPLVPWWGPSRFRGVPWWGGWAGPRRINNTIIENKTVININQIVYHNTSVHNAVITTSQQPFGHGRAQYTHVSAAAVQAAHPLQSPPSVPPSAASRLPGVSHAPRPPKDVQTRSVVATRTSPTVTAPMPSAPAPGPASPRPQPRLVAPLPAKSSRHLAQPPVGTGAERLPSPPPPRFEEAWRQKMSRSPGQTPPAQVPAPHLSTPRDTTVFRPPHKPQPVEPPHQMQPILPSRTPPSGALPGRPAMQLRSVKRPPTHAGQPAPRKKFSASRSPAH